MRRLVLFALAVLAGLVIAAAPAAAGVPQGFVGMAADGPFFYPAMNQGANLDQMVASGVESLRTVFSWSAMQPYKSFVSVPPNLLGQYQDAGGVPTNFSAMDQLVALAASRRMTVLPVVEFAPNWDTTSTKTASSPPATPGPYARFVAALARRYGTHGSFWAANPTLPRLPIRMWQIWNEPNFTNYWNKQPFEPGYVKLLRATRPALKAADPGARIVLAGLANFSWEYLASIYKYRGARKLFDYVAVHPYTATPGGAVTILRKARAVMKHNGDGNKPMLATEISWPSAKGKAKTTFENATTESGQATKLAQAVALLAKDRKSLKLSAFYYYTWITNETPGLSRNDEFNFAGLFKFLDGQGTTPKPAFSAFSRAALSIEGCRAKGSLATICLH